MNSIFGRKNFQNWFIYCNCLTFCTLRSSWNLNIKFRPIVLNVCFCQMFNEFSTFECFSRETCESWIPFTFFFAYSLFITETIFFFFFLSKSGIGMKWNEIEGNSTMNADIHSDRDDWYNNSMRCDQSKGYNNKMSMSKLFQNECSNFTSTQKNERKKKKSRKSREIRGGYSLRIHSW